MRDGPPITRPCERDLPTEGPCFGPVYPPETAAPAWRPVRSGRFLCENHIAQLCPDELHSPRDPTKPYHVDAFGIGVLRPVRVGQMAKVLFVGDCGRERGMSEGVWVRVVVVDGDMVGGVVENRPADPEAVGVRLGSRVEFPVSAVRVVQ